MRTRTSTPHPDCAARGRAHHAHDLAGPGGNKPGSHCDGREPSWLGLSWREMEEDVRYVAGQSTAHNYGRTVWGIHRIGDERWVVRMSSWPRAQEAIRALRAHGYAAEDTGVDCIDVQPNREEWS